MSHLTMEQLLELRAPGLEPGQEMVRTHLDECPACRAEADRLAQRIARLRALPTPRPSRDRFQEVRARYVAEGRGRRLRALALGAVTLAAAVALAVVMQDGRTAGRQDGRPTGLAAADELQGVMTRSQELEAALRAYNPDGRMLDGRTAGIALRIEDGLGAVDRQLEMLNMMQLGAQDLRREQLRLWRERVGLLDALVDVHLTRASYAGM
jgi:hypothetical protein